MKKPALKNPAEIADKFLNRTALAMLLLAFSYGCHAANYFVPAGWANDALDVAGISLSILIVIVLFPSYSRYLMARKKGTCRYEDGYIMGMFKRAMVHAFTVNFLSLLFLEALTERFFHAIPTRIFLEGLLILTLVTLSLSFFMGTRDTDEEADEFDTDDAA